MEEEKLDKLVLGGSFESGLCVEVSHDGDTLFLAGLLRLSPQVRPHHPYRSGSQSPRRIHPPSSSKFSHHGQGHPPLPRPRSGVSICIRY